MPDVHSWDTRLILQRTNCSTAAWLFWQDEDQRAVHFPLPCTRLTQGPTHPIRFSITARFCNLGLFLILCKPTIALGPKIFSFEGVASICIMHPLINFMLVSRPSATFQGSVFQPLCGFCKRNSKAGIIPHISHHVKQVKHRQGVVHKLRKKRCQILGSIELHCVSKNLTHHRMHQITQWVHLLPKLIGLTPPKFLLYSFGYKSSQWTRWQELSRNWFTSRFKPKFPLASASWPTTALCAGPSPTWDIVIIWGYVQSINLKLKICMSRCMVI